MLQFKNVRSCQKWEIRMGVARATWVFLLKLSPPAHPGIVSLQLSLRCGSFPGKLLQLVLLPWCVHDNLTIFAQSLQHFLSPSPPEALPASMPFPVPPLLPSAPRLCLSFACSCAFALRESECPFSCWQPLLRCSVLCCLSSLSHSIPFPADETHVALAEKLKYSSSSIQNPLWCACLTVGVWLKVILTMSFTLLFLLKWKRTARLYV